MTFPEPRLRELLETLVRAEVRFILVGGLAVGAWGAPRGTKDIDIVPDPSPENLERLAAILVNLDGRVVAGDGLLESSAIRTFLRAGDKTLVRTELGDLDVLQGLPQVPRFQDMIDDAEPGEVDEIKVLVCSLADLRAMKRAADRDLDRVDLEALEIARPEEPR